MYNEDIDETNTDLEQEVQEQEQELVEALRSLVGDQD